MIRRALLSSGSSQVPEVGPKILASGAVMNPVFALVGPHYAGKTTTARRLLGLPEQRLSLDSVRQHADWILPAELASDRHMTIDGRVRNVGAYADRSTAYFMSRTAPALVFPHPSLDGKGNETDIAHHISWMARLGPTLVEGLMVKSLMLRQPNLFPWIAITFTLSEEVLIERARTRRARGNYGTQKRSKTPEDTARSSLNGWRSRDLPRLLATDILPAYEIGDCAEPWWRVSEIISQHV